MEIFWFVLQKVEHRIIIYWSSNSTLKYMPEINRKWDRHLHINNHVTVIHCSPKVNKTRVRQEMNAKQNMVHTQHGMFLSHKREWSSGVVAQWKGIWLGTMRLQVQSLASVNGLGSGIVVSCGVDHNGARILNFCGSGSLHMPCVGS